MGTTKYLISIVFLAIIWLCEINNTEIKKYGNEGLKKYDIQFTSLT